MSPVTNRKRSRHRSFGQSLVEFALVTPVLVALVVLVADFGRIFAVNLALEAAARNAAEAMSNAYIANPPGPLDAPAPPGATTYYGPLHAVAVKSVCAETQGLANSAFDSGTGSCVGMPLIQVCLHDSQDTECSSEAQSASIPSGCAAMASPPTSANGPSGSPRWAEVRVCYHFTPILHLPLLSFGDFWLERQRTFVVPCYFKTGTTECG